MSNINVASLCGLSLGADDGNGGRIVVTLDFRTLKVPNNFDYTEPQVVAATLECLRRIAGNKLSTTSIEAKYKTDGQEEIKKLVGAFIKHPKDKEFPIP